MAKIHAFMTVMLMCVPSLARAEAPLAMQLGNAYRTYIGLAHGCRESPLHQTTFYAARDDMIRTFASLKGGTVGKATIFVEAFVEDTLQSDRPAVLKNHGTEKEMSETARALECEARIRDAEHEVKVVKAKAGLAD